MTNADRYNQQLELSLPLITLCLFIISSTVAWGSTSVVSYQLLQYVRSVSVLLFFAAFFMLLAKNTVLSRAGLYSLTILFFLFIFGGVNTLIHNDQTGDLIFVGFNYLMVLALIYVVYLYNAQSDVSLTLVMITYGLLLLTITLATDGFEFTPVPHFVMGYASQQEGVNYTITYGQGVTKIFGLSAIASFHFFTNTKSLLLRCASLMFAVSFLSLSAVGGSRGDFLAVLAVVFFIVLKGRSFFVLATAAAVIFALAVIVDATLGLEGFVLFERFSRLDAASSYRLSLLVDAFTLISQSPDCLIFGCGFNYFQSYYNYPPDIYPHNIFVEYVIAFGVCIAFLSLIFFLLGLYRFRKTGRSLGLLGFLLIFFGLIGLKSGTLVSSWFAMAAAAYFMGFAFRTSTIKGVS